jgi:hypothetical protein
MAPTLIEVGVTPGEPVPTPEGHCSVAGSGAELDVSVGVLAAPAPAVPSVPAATAARVAVATVIAASLRSTIRPSLARM